MLHLITIRDIRFENKRRKGVKNFVRKPLQNPMLTKHGTKKSTIKSLGNKKKDLDYSEKEELTSCSEEKEKLSILFESGSWNESRKRGLKKSREKEINSESSFGEESGSYTDASESKSPSKPKKPKTVN